MRCSGLGDSIASEDCLLRRQNPIAPFKTPMTTIQLHTLHFPVVYHGDQNTMVLKTHCVSLTCGNQGVVFRSLLNVNSVILCISIGVAPAWAMVGIILQDYSHPGTSQGGTGRNVDIGRNSAAV
jgi:hypothetical protein